MKTILPKLLTALQLPLGGSITSNNVASDFSSTPEKAPIIAIEIPPPFCHYRCDALCGAKRYAVAVDTADIVNMKRERAVDTGEVQAEGVKHETATRRKRWTPGSSSEPRH